MRKRNISNGHTSSGGPLKRGLRLPDLVPLEMTEIDPVAHVLTGASWSKLRHTRWPGSPDLRQALQLDADNAKVLEKSRIIGGRELARRLRGPVHRLLHVPSGASAVCFVPFQRFFVDTALKLSNASDVPVYALSVVPPMTDVPKGALRSSKLAEIESKMTRALAASGIDWAFLGLDISFNELSAKLLGDLWQPQYFGLIGCSELKRTRALLRHHFPSSTLATRPVYISGFDNSALGASYGLKFNAVRRVSYLDTRGSRPCWNTRKVSLRPPQQAEYLLFLDQTDIFKRLLTFGINFFVTRTAVIAQHAKVPSKREPKTRTARNTVGK